MARKKTKLTFEKRQREQRKKLKRKEKLERKHNKEELPEGERPETDEEETYITAEELFNQAIGLDPETPPND